VLGERFSAYSWQDVRSWGRRALGHWEESVEGQKMPSRRIPDCAAEGESSL